MYEKEQLAFNFWYCALSSGAPYRPKNTVCTIQPQPDFIFI